MSGTWRWVNHRRYTVGLSTFLVAWFIGQLAVQHAFGTSAAEWWFYWETPDAFPPETISPGIFFAAISHQIDRMTHIGSNVGILLLLGAFIEPRITGRKMTRIVIGIGYGSILLANSTAVLHQSWMTAGISGGVFGLMAYTGLSHAHIIRDSLVSNGNSHERVEWFAVCFSLLAALLIPPCETFLFGGFNSGHTFGILLGFSAAYFDEMQVAERI